MRRSLVRAAVRPGKRLSLQSTAENWQWRRRTYCRRQTVPDRCSSRREGSVADGSTHGAWSDERWRSRRIIRGLAFMIPENFWMANWCILMHLGTTNITSVQPRAARPRLLYGPCLPLTSRPWPLTFQVFHVLLSGIYGENISPEVWIRPPPAGHPFNGYGAFLVWAYTICGLEIMTKLVCGILHWLALAAAVILSSWLASRPSCDSHDWTMPSGPVSGWACLQHAAIRGVFNAPTQCTCTQLLCHLPRASTELQCETASSSHSQHRSPGAYLGGLACACSPWRWKQFMY